MTMMINKKSRETFGGSLSAGLVFDYQTSWGVFDV